MPAIPSLKNARDFRRAYESGARGRSDGVTAVVHASGHTRLGLTVASSVGTAVRRNRIRRRLKAIVNDHGGVPGHDLVLRVDPRAADAAFSDLERHTLDAVEIATGRLAR